MTLTTVSGGDAFMVRLKPADALALGKALLAAAAR
jgi:hypothetical protein